MSKLTQKTSCSRRCYQLQIMEIATIKNLTYRRVKNWANGINVCPKKEQLSNLLHDLFRDELVITHNVDCRITNPYEACLSSLFHLWLRECPLSPRFWKKLILRTEQKLHEWKALTNYLCFCLPERSLPIVTGHAKVTILSFDSFKRNSNK